MEIEITYVGRFGTELDCLAILDADGAVEKIACVTAEGWSVNDGELDQIRLADLIAAERARQLMRRD